RFTLEEALHTANAGAPRVLAARAEAARMEALRGAASDMPGTEVMYMRGQYNAYVKEDNSITATQTIPPPTLIAARASAARAEAEAAQAHRGIVASERAWAVRAAWHRRHYLHAVEHLLLEQDSTWNELARSTALRAETGEIPPLARATAEVRAGQSQDELRRHRSLLAAERLAFGSLL